MPNPLSQSQVRGTAVGLLFRQNSREVLCVCRRDMGLWIFPGGAIDPGETAADAVVRELEEETGFAVGILRKAAEYAPTCSLTNPVHLYEVERLSGELVLTSETCDVGYFPVAALPEPFLDTHRGWLEDVLRNRQQLIRRAQTEVTWPKAIMWALCHPLMTVRFYLAKLGWMIPVADAPGVKKRR